MAPRVNPNALAERQQPPDSPPPGLAVPRSLQPTQDVPSLPPGFEDVYAASTRSRGGIVLEPCTGSGEVGNRWSQKVCIHNLPNGILSDDMLWAVFEQAGLEENVLDFVGRAGSSCGEVVVTLSSPWAVAECVRHFQGCNWDKYSAAIEVEVLPLEHSSTLHAEVKTETEVQPCSFKARALAPAQQEALTLRHGAAKGLSFNAPVFVPGVVIADAKAAWSSDAPAFVGSSPAFVPGAIADAATREKVCAPAFVEASPAFFVGYVAADEAPCHIANAPAFVTASFEAEARVATLRDSGHSDLKRRDDLDSTHKTSSDASTDACESEEDEKLWVERASFAMVPTGG
mmetsp:Transcript_33497/g.92556  ORF Transcript_33497/g.92556 Transcript_33497/m.92556 type:complete len:344 (-) Transcript_33497:152-1183(-)